MPFVAGRKRVFPPVIFVRRGGESAVFDECAFRQVGHGLHELAGIVHGYLCPMQAVYGHHVTTRSVLLGVLAAKAGQIESSYKYWSLLTSIELQDVQY